MNELRSFCRKLLLLFVLLSIVFVTENVLFSMYLFPINQHYSSLGKISKNYLIADTRAAHDSIFYNQDQLIIHTIIHETIEELDFCQNNIKQNCYLASSFLSVFEDDNCLKPLIIKGKLPSNENQININSNLSKRLNLNVGDHVLLKSDTFFRDVEVCGIIKNIFGFDKYSSDISSKFFCITFENLGYIQNNRGKVFKFCDDYTNALEVINLHSESRYFYKMCFWVFIVLFLINVLIYLGIFKIYANNLRLSEYYTRLSYLGFSKLSIFRKYVFDVSIFLIINIFLVILCSIYQFWASVLITQLLSCLCWYTIKLLCGGKGKW